MTASINPPTKIGDRYVCTGCGLQLELSEMRRCPECGFYYCERCYHKHKCRDLGDGVAIIKTPVGLYSPSTGSLLNYVDPTKERKFCDKCGNLFRPQELSQCDKCGAWLCKACLPYHVCNSQRRDKWRKEQRSAKWNLPKESFSKKAVPIVILVVVIVVAIIVGLVLLQYSGTLAISSSPSGASVYLGGEYKGITPLTISGLSDGNYSLTLTKEGYNTYSTTVRVTSGKTTTENCALTRIAITGSLVITSSPSGASVYVDDVYQGLTPKTVYGLSAGNHVVCIEKFGYFSQLGNPYVTVGEETRYHARLL